MGLIQKIADRVNPHIAVEEDWPPQSERARLKRYSDFRALFDGDHDKVLDERHLARDYKLYIACNIPGLEPKIFADLMLGEPVTLEFPEDTPDEAQAVVNRIWEENDLQTLAYENVLETSPLGDGVFVISRDDDEQATVRTFQPEQWFPLLNPDNVRDVLAHSLCWVKSARIDGKDRDYLRVIGHHKGMITNDLLVLENGKVKGEADASVWRHFYGDNIPAPEIDTEVDEFLVVHVPNMRTAREYYGRSDYTGRTPLFSMLNSRLTQVDQILHLHSDPRLRVPHEAFDALTTQNPDGLSTDQRLLRMGLNGESPEYLTWDGQIAQNLETIDKVTEEILMTGEVDRQLVGLGEVGNLSGRALRILLMRTMSKVNRKWDKYVKPALEEVLRIAQLVEGVEEPVVVSLRKSDGLPSDRLEDIQASRELVEGGFSSRRREIMKLNDMTDAEAEELEQEIDAEDDVSRNSEPLQDATQRRTPIAVSVNAEDLG